MHQCSRMEPPGRTWEASTPSTYPSGRCSLQYLSLCTCRRCKFKKYKEKISHLKINKKCTNCVKFLIIVIRQSWNTMNLKAVRRLLLDGYPEINCKYHPGGMHRNIFTEKDVLLYFCG